MIPLLRTLCLTNQVDADAGPDEVSHVDVYGMAAVLGYLSQPGEACCHAEGEHQQRLQQLGGAADAGVEIHLRRKSNAMNLLLMLLCLAATKTAQHFSFESSKVLKMSNRCTASLPRSLSLFAKLISQKQKAIKKGFMQNADSTPLFNRMTRCHLYSQRSSANLNNSL